jgi:hypothetical protein
MTVNSSALVVNVSLAIGLLAAAALTPGCGGKAEAGGISPQVMADGLYAVMAADRATYATDVVNRLQDKEKVIKADEHFQDAKALPLPAQMFRLGAERAQKSGATFSYSLLSQWPINKQNGPRTEAEKAGLKAVADTGKNFYTEETIAGKKYFTAAYPDKAVTEACSNCHNAHQDSPRKDFKLGDVIGGVVIRIPLDKP